MSGETRILLVEDEARIAEVVQTYLERDGYMVVWKMSGEEALEDFARRAADLVILDLMLPGIGGEEVCRVLREQSDVPIIMLTARDSEEDLLRGLTVGADDYITKPFSPREVCARVRVLLRRAHSASEAQVDIMVRGGGRLQIDSAKRRVFLDQREVELTESEFRLLLSLARFPGRAYSRYELINKVQGYEFEGYERTIDAHVKNLRHKLGEDARAPHFIETVYGRGYRFAETER
ncbi:MAG: response regulator transcription factor [Thermoleophilia bacterium]